jgi:hypothetical protein
MRTTAGQDVEKIETKLRQLGTKLDRLAASDAERTLDTDIEYRKQIGDAKDKHTVVRERLQTFRNAGGQKWDNFKDSIELAWRDLEKAFLTVRHGPPVPIPVEAEAVRRPED